MQSILYSLLKPLIRICLLTFTNTFHVFIPHNIEQYMPMKYIQWCGASLTDLYLTCTMNLTQLRMPTHPQIDPECPMALPDVIRYQNTNVILE
jgi:hypothetical protein